MKKTVLTILSALLFASGAWAVSETISWSGTSLTGTGGTNVSAGTATAVDGSTYSAGTISISSSKIQTESKKHDSDSYWEDFSSCSTEGCTDATTTARIEFPITVASGFNFAVSEVDFKFEQGGGGGPAVHVYLVQGSTSTWIGYTTAATKAYDELSIDLSAGAAKLVFVLGVASNPSNNRQFKFSNISIKGTSTSAAPTHSITLNGNHDGAANGIATATEGSNLLTSISAPTYAGHVVEGYYQESGCTTLIADAAGNLQADKEGFTDSDGKWTATEDKILYAKWLLPISPALSYHVTTLNPTYITTANPTLTGNDGNGTVTYESSDESVVTVNANTGLVTAVAAGTTTITANIASNGGYAAGSAICNITVLDDELTDLYIFKKGTGYGGTDDSKFCISSELANGTENATSASATLAYSTYSVDGSTGMKRPGTAGTTVTYTFTVTQSNYAISSICTYGKLEEPAGAQYSWDGGKTWNPLSKYSESKMYFGAPTGKYPTSFIIKYVGISTSSGGLWWRNALVTMEPAPHILSLTAGKWASFCPSYSVTIPANVTAYKASINGAKDEITATAIDGGIIPAAEGVLLKATATDEYTFVKTETTASVSDNFLKGTTERTSSATLKGTETYLMALLKNEDKFVSYTGSYFPANRAYFAVTPPTLAPSAIRIVEEENNATSLDNIEYTDETVKFIQNGQLYIKRNGVVYDAMGRIIR